MAEANSSMSQSFIRRQSKIENKDIISSLPDEVLSHILSFLPTRYAVRTSILSRRWQYTWTFVSKLYFDDQLVFNPKISVSDRKYLFTKFVNRVLLLVRNPIKEFTLEVRNSNSITKEINSWIFSAIVHKVENLELHISPSRVRLPIVVFRCETIRILKLNNTVSLKIPESVWLPNLKLLHFKNIDCLGDDMLVKFISGSPVLEELQINRPYYDELRNLCVQSSSLKRLLIDASGGVGCIGKVDIDAPNLQVLCLKGSFIEELKMMKLSSLAKATIEVATHDNVEQLLSGTSQMTYLLNQIADVKTLTISIESLDFLLSEECFLCFNNLVRLELKDGDYGWSILSALLRRAPKLEKLIFINDIEFICWSPPRSYIEEHVPECLLSTLVMVEFKGFRGITEEIELVEKLLKYGKVLKQIMISSNPEEQTEILKKIVIFPGASINCQILFH